MKKKVTITIEVNIDHLERDEWTPKNEFYLNEVDEALDDIRINGGGRGYTRYSGKTESKATSYTLSIEKIKKI